MKKLSYILYTCLMATLAGCSEYPVPTSVAPEMNTGEVSNIYRLGATIQGTFTEEQKSIGPVKECGILISIMQSMAEPDTLRAVGAKSGQTFAVQAEDLEPGTVYYYQSYASSGVSFAKGEVKHFTTSEENAPVFDEHATISQDYRSISLAVHIKDEGGSPIYTKGFCWKLESEGGGDPTITNHVMNVDTESNDYSGRIYDLLPNQTYLVRAYANNRMGTGYSSVTYRVHTDATTTPSMSSITVLEQAVNSIRVQSKVLSEGLTGIYEKGFCWGTESGPTREGFHKVVAGTNSITEVLTGMRPNTEYYLRAYAVNDNGIGYGDETTFMLGQTSRPMVSEVTIEDYTGYSITISASLLSDGGEVLLEKGFCYSDLVMPTIEGAKVVVEEMEGNKFRATIHNLAPSTTYAIRAYARNSQGVAYSVSVCVETLDETHLSPDINGWDDKPAEDGSLK